MEGDDIVNLDEKTTAMLYEAIAAEDLFPTPKGMTVHECVARIVSAVKRTLPDPEPVIKVIESEEKRLTSSISVGTETKGGAVKVYFDPANPEEALERVDNAMVVRCYAKNIVDAATKGGDKFPPDSAIGKKFQDIVDKHVTRVQNGEFDSKRK